MWKEIVKWLQCKGASPENPGLMKCGIILAAPLKLVGTTLLEVHVMIFLASSQQSLNAVFRHAGVLFGSPPKLLVHFQASGAFSKGKKMTTFSYAHSCQSCLLCHMLLSPLIAAGWTQHSAVSHFPIQWRMISIKLRQSNCASCGCLSFESLSLLAGKCIFPL